MPNSSRFCATIRAVGALSSLGCESLPCGGAVARSEHGLLAREAVSRAGDEVRRHRGGAYFVPGCRVVRLGRWDARHV
jgi:hypothetical protein